jgi:dienelactone hydrolase
MLRLSACLVLALSAFPVRAGDGPPVEKGTVRFAPLDDQKTTPERYRLDARSFDYELAFLHELPGCDLSVSQLRFPTALPSKHKENDTVWAEYYRPHGKGPFPGVIVLDILAGNGQVARLVGTHLAQSGIAALYVHLPYYGPRRPPGSKLRFLSVDLEHSLTAVRQGVLDLRLAAAWLEARPEIDGKRLGILGVSLGSFLAALTGEMEPRLGRVAVVLGGGGLLDAYYDDPRAAPYRKVYEALGGTKEKLVSLFAPVDPLTCAGNLKDRKLLMLAAKRDEIVPPKMAEALWRASGRQAIVWYDCTHYGAVLYLPEALVQVVKHFRAE